MSTREKDLLPNAGRRAFFTCTAVVAGAAVTGAFAAAPVKAAAPEGKRKFMEEATRLATESVEKGWGGRSAP